MKDLSEVLENHSDGYIQIKYDDSSMETKSSVDQLSGTLGPLWFDERYLF